MHLRLISNYDTKRSTDQSFQEFASLIVLEKYSRSTALSFKGGEARIMFYIVDIT